MAKTEPTLHDFPVTNRWSGELQFTAIGGPGIGKFNSVVKASGGLGGAGASQDWKSAVQSALDTTVNEDIDIQVNWAADGGDAGTVALFGMIVEVIN